MPPMVQAGSIPAGGFVYLAFPDAKRKDDIRGMNRAKKCFEEEKKMKKEDFVALGISEDLAEKAAKASEEEFKNYVSRSRLNEEISAKKNAEKSYNDVKAELDKLKASAGDNEALQAQIKTLQDELKDKESKYASEIAEMKMTNAIRAALGNSAQDAELVAGLIDRGKVILQDDGTVTGLDEQIKTLRESKGFLFKDTDDGYPDVHDGGEPNGRSGKRTTREQFADWLNGN